MRDTKNACLLMLIILFAGCDRNERAPASTAPVAPEAVVSFDNLNRGAQLFQVHCAQCHGPEAEGHPDWRTAGVVAAPPLNGTGNDVKRTRAELVGAIKNGVKRNGAVVMPGWAGRLSDAEIVDLVTWFQALWPAELQVQWRKQNPAPPPPRG